LYNTNFFLKLKGGIKIPDAVLLWVGDQPNPESTTMHLDLKSDLTVFIDEDDDAVITRLIPQLFENYQNGIGAWPSVDHALSIAAAVALNPRGDAAGRIVEDIVFLANYLLHAEHLSAETRAQLTVIRSAHADLAQLFAETEAAERSIQAQAAE